MGMTAYKWGAISYILWGVMHAMIGLQILWINLGQSSQQVIRSLYLDAGPQATPAQLGSVIGALINQHGWNLFWFGIVAVTVAVIGNWRNNRAAYWANLALVSLADIGFIFAILIPGYINVAMGIGGPILWVVAMVLSTIGILKTKSVNDL
jgi:hypothetical protein